MLRMKLEQAACSVQRAAGSVREGSLSPCVSGWEIGPSPEPTQGGFNASGSSPLGGGGVAGGDDGGGTSTRPHEPLVGTGSNGWGRTPLPFARRTSLRYSPLRGENKKRHTPRVRYPMPRAQTARDHPRGGANRAKLGWWGIASLQAAGCKLLAGR